MSNIKSKNSSRLLAAILSLVMVLSMLPITGMTAMAATDEHPDAVTITVVDEDGNAVENATVDYIINSMTNGEIKNDSATTDAKGVVEVLASDEYAEGDLTIQATITAENYEDGEITELEISSADQNIQVDITSKMIKDVTISWNEDLVYTGESQELVSVTQVEGDTITYEIDGEIVTIPEKMEAGTYTVKVTVERTGKNPLTATKDITIAAKTLEIGITASTDLVYNSEEQALVTVPTGIEIGDKVTWTIGDITETYTVDADNIDFIPRKTNVGEYKVKLSVERNANYTVYNSEEMTVNISAIEAANIQYSADGRKATVTFEIPKMVLGNDNQFNGTVEFTTTDRSGNVTDPLQDTKRIVVDNIAPTAQVSYNEATNTVGDISYYNGNINATVTITEANFYAEDVQVMVSKDGGTATAVTPTWNDSSVDVHVGTFTLSEDGDYVVTINYQDKSSNTMATYASKQMTIDTEIMAPTFTINDVAKTEVGGAYKGDATITLSYEDQNFDTKDVKLTRTRFGVIDEDVKDKFINVNEQEKGGNATFTIPTEVENDGIYTLTVTMTDKANHTTTSTMSFIINRFGSVYEYDTYLVSLITNGGQYITIDEGNDVAITNDLVIKEYNSDKLLEGSLKILITRDGETVDAVYTTSPENMNDQMNVSEKGWYEYVYTISKSNFEEDGVYKISITSQYSAVDSEKNDSTSVPDNSIDETGEQILDTMTFTVDTTAPEIRNIVNLEEKIPDADKIIDGKLPVDYTVVDIGGLKSVEIIIDGNSKETITDFGDSVFSYTGQFEIEESTSAQTIQIKVTDLAGNVTDTASEDFSTGDVYVFNDEVTVSRNALVRWFANPVTLWGTIGGVAVLGGGSAGLIVFRRRKKLLV